MFPILVFAILLYMLHIAGVLFPLVILCGMVIAFAGVWMFAGFCVFWVFELLDSFFDTNDED